MEIKLPVCLNIRREWETKGVYISDKQREWNDIEWKADLRIADKEEKSNISKLDITTKAIKSQVNFELWHKSIK